MSNIEFWLIILAGVTFIGSHVWGDLGNWSPPGVLLSEVGRSILTTCLFSAVHDYQYDMSRKKFYKIVDRGLEEGLFVPTNDQEMAVAREAQEAVRAEMEEAASSNMQGQRNNNVTANIFALWIFS